MAYMNQDKKKVIAENLKPILKKYGVKGTLSVSGHMAITLKLKEGKIDFFADSKEEVDYQRDYIQVNPYWFQDHFKGKSKDFLTEAFEALKSADFYDNSDAQTDYFDIAYYYYINVGQYNKPYRVVEA